VHLLIRQSWTEESLALIWDQLPQDSINKAILSFTKRPQACVKVGWIFRMCFKEQENRAVARKPRDAAAVLFGLEFANNIRYNFKSIANFLSHLAYRTRELYESVTHLCTKLCEL